MDAHLEAGERRAKLVRGRGDELRFQTVDLAQVGDVLEQHHGPDGPAVAVAHRRGALPERLFRAVHDKRHDGRALLAATSTLLRLEHVEHRHRQARVASHVLDRPAEHGRLGTEERLRRTVDALHAALGVGHDHRIIEGVDRRFSGLLGDEDLAQVGLAQLPDPPRHLVELGRQHAELVAGPDLHDRVEVARGDAAGRRRQLPHRPDDAVRKENRELDAADDERRRGAERR